MKIVRIRRRRDGGRVAIEVDDEAVGRLNVADEVALRLGLHVGQVLDQELLDAISEQDARFQAKDAALRLLGHRPRGTAELRQRLRSKGYPAETIDQCLDELTRAGLLNDLEFAISFARSRVRSRPRGQPVIAAELRSRGIADDIAAQALRRIFEEEEIEEIDLARRVADKFVPRRGEDPRKRRQRFYLLLARKGFASDTIRQVVDESPHIA